MRLAFTADLGDELFCGAASSLGVAGIDGDNFRVQKLGERSVTDARQLDLVDALILKILAGPQREGIGRANQRAGF